MTDTHASKTTWTVYYGAGDDGYPTGRSFHTLSEAEAWYVAHKSFSATLVEMTTLKACTGGNPYSGIPATDV